MSSAVNSMSVVRTSADHEITLANGRTIMVATDTPEKAVQWPIGEVSRESTCLVIRWKTGEVTIVPWTAVIRYDRRSA